MKLRGIVDFLKNRWVPVGIVILVILRFYGIASNDIAMDEPFTLFYAQADFSFMWGMLPGENNPPLFFLLMHFWISLFGLSPLAVRFLPVLFSILTVIMIYQTGTRFFSKRIGFTAAALITLSDYHQLFAHEARVYSLFGLLTVLSMYLFLRLAEEPKDRKILILITIINILLIYSHFFGFFVLLIQFVCLMVLPQMRRLIIKPVGVSFGLTMAGFLPYLPVILDRFSQSAGTGTWVGKPVISDLYTMIWRYMNVPVSAVAAITILLAALVLFIIRYQRKNTHFDEKVLSVVIWFIFPYLMMFGFSFVIPMFLDRYTVFISTGFFLLLAIAVNSILPPKIDSGYLVAPLILMMAVTFRPAADNKRELKKAVSYIKTNQKGRVSVIITPSWLELGFAYHYDLDMFRNYRELRRLLNENNIFPASGLKTVDTAAFAGSDRILFFEEWSALTDPEQSIISYLNSRYEYQGTTFYRESFKVHSYKVR